MALTVGCGDGDLIRMQGFPEPQYVEMTRSLDENLFDGRYRSGYFDDFARDERGNLYITTTEPYQVMAVTPEGQILWTHDGSALPAGEFVSIPELSVCGENLLVLDPEQIAVYSSSLDGEVGAVRSFPTTIRNLWALSDGGFLAYPSRERGYAVDRYDFLFERMGPLLPKDGFDGFPPKGQCLAVGLPEDRVAVYWVPDRTLTVLDDAGREEWVVRLDEASIRKSLKRSQRRMKDGLEKKPGGTVGVIAAFPRLSLGRQGALGLSFLHDGGESRTESHTGRYSAESSGTQYYEFTLQGEPVRRVVGFGPMRGGVIATQEGEFVTLSGLENAVCVFAPVTPSK